jgi:L,D-transpeptidase YcbB
VVTSRINKGITARISLVVFLCICSVPSVSNSSVPVKDAELAPLIKQKITLGSPGSKKTIQGEQVYSAVLVAGFYKGREYQPAWSHDGRLMQQVGMLIKAVNEAYGDGLSPDYYHLSRISSLVTDTRKGPSSGPDSLADLDILLTDAFLTLGCHLSAGCVNPLAAESEWFAEGARSDVSALLEQSLRKKKIREALTGLRPGKGLYTRLRSTLAQYRGMAAKGEWPLISAGPPIKKGSRSARVIELRKRLAASGDLRADEAAGDIFNDRLEQSVIFFQERHGLDGDGVVSRETLSALNVPLKQRIRQMELNMERLRWILGSLEERFIIVNIADFYLEVVEKDKPVLSMNVVVGTPYTSTPIFTAKMTYIVINPSWHIPRSIAQKEIMVKAAENARYFAEHNIEVMENSGAGEHRIDPQTVDWSKMNGNNSHYRFRQKPGNTNALGQLKFMFPNSYDVYLHDTPSKGLFSKNVRTFSHGCIRLENPIGLAEYLLREDPQWSRDTIKAAMDKGTEQIVQLPRPLNVHLLYLTAWVDERNTLQFRNDIYKRDRKLDEALRKKPYIQ